MLPAAYDFFTAPADYAALDQVVIVFPSSPSVECVNVSVLVDGVVEAEERLRLTLTTNDTAISVGQPDMAEVVIINTDGKCKTETDGNRITCRYTVYVATGPVWPQRVVLAALKCHI